MQRWVEKITMDFLDYLSKKYKFKKEKYYFQVVFFLMYWLIKLLGKEKILKMFMLHQIWETEIGSRCYLFDFIKVKIKKIF